MATPPGTVATDVGAARLYEQYGSQIYRYCLGRLRDREEAADAAQNTFLRVHVALEKGVVPQYEASWLYKIAHNVCLSWIDTSGRRALIETPRDIDSLDESLLAAPASEHEAVEELAEALAALPHKLRQAILLREWQGLSYTEIAAAMNTTVPAVETLLVRARREMAARLRRAAAALLDVAGLRALFSDGVDKVAAGAALVAVGGSGIGAAVVLAGSPSAPHPRPAASIARPLVAVLPSRTTATTSARPTRRHGTTVSRVTHRVSSPDVASPSPPVAQHPEAPAAKTVRQPAPAPVPALTVPTLPQPASVTTPALPSLPALPQVDATPTLPQLPVTAPTVTIPTVTIP